MSTSRLVGQHTREPVTGDYSSSIALFLRLSVSLYRTHFDSLTFTSSSSHHITSSCLAFLKHRQTLSYPQLGCQQSYLYHSRLPALLRRRTCPSRVAASSSHLFVLPNRLCPFRPDCSSLRTLSTFIDNKAPPSALSAQIPKLPVLDRHYRHHPKHLQHPDNRHCTPHHVLYRPVFLYLRPPQRCPRPQTRRRP